MLIFGLEPTQNVGGKVVWGWRLRLCYQVIQTRSGHQLSISHYLLQRVLHIIQESSRDVPELGELARSKLGEPENSSVPGRMFSLPEWHVWGLCLRDAGRNILWERFWKKQLAVRVPCASQYLLLWATKNCVALSESLKGGGLEKGKNVADSHANNSRALAVGWACQTRFCVSVHLFNWLLPNY